MTQPPENAGYPQQPAGPYPPPAPAGPPQQPPGQFQQQPPGQFQQPPAGPELNKPQPAGGPGFNPPTAAAFNPANVAKADWLVLGVGVLMLIFGFFGWESASSAYGSYSIGGWNGWWVVIQLILIVVLAIKAVQVFTGNLRKEIPPIAIVGAGALLILLYLIALIQAFSDTSGLDLAGSGISVGPGFGIWACLILSIVFTYGLTLAAQNDGKLPFKVPSIAGL